MTTTTEAPAMTEAEAQLAADIEHQRAIIAAWERRHRLVWRVLGAQAQSSGLCGDYEEELRDIAVPAPIVDAVRRYDFPEPATRASLRTDVPVRITAMMSATVSRDWVLNQIVGTTNLQITRGPSFAEDRSFAFRMEFVERVQAIEGRCPCGSLDAAGYVGRHLRTNSQYFAQASGYTIGLRTEEIRTQCDAEDHDRSTRAF